MPDTSHTDGRPRNPGVRTEPSDLSVRYILAFGLTMIVSAVVIHAGIYWLFEHYTAREARIKESPFPLAAERPPRPREPLLEGIRREEGVNPYVHADTLRTTAPEELHSYGWVDHKKGVVRIPIEAAMKLVVEQKLLPSRPEREGEKDRATGRDRR
jgi:hypothetical protein